MFGRTRRCETPEFDIVVNFAAAPSAEVAAAFAAAEEVWETVLSGYAPGIGPRQLLINAAVAPIDGAGGVLGQVRRYGTFSFRG